MFLAEKYDSLVKRRKIWHYYEIYKTSNNGFREICEPRLKELLDYSFKDVPFYKKIGKSNEKAEDIFEFIKNLPIITKEKLNTYPRDFISNKKQKGVYKNSTGGSTGEPLTVYQDREYKDKTLAGKYLFYTWAGWKPGDKILKIWGSPRDVLKQKESLRKKMSSKLRKIKILDAFSISPESIARYVSEINNYKPVILECYVDAAYTIASEILRRGIKLKHKPKGIITSAGTLYPEFEKTIKEAFQAPVYNRYGSREAGDIASTCPKGKIHVNPFTHFVEIVDSNGNPLNEGTGRIIVTLLTNYTMPLIRYEIGDMATISNKKEICECGRDWQTLDRIDGRSGNIIIKRDGTVISPVFFIHFFGVVHNKGFLSKYQIVQDDYEKFTLKISLKNGYYPDSPVVKESLKNLMKNLKEVLGSDVVINVKYLDDIPPLPSGKFMFTISKVNRRL